MGGRWGGSTLSSRVGASATLSLSVEADMHEYSLVRALLDRVDASVREHGATSVAALRVRIGAVAGVEMELFASAFELAKAGTGCAAAVLELVPAAERWECTRCRGEAPRGGVLKCPACGAAVRLAAGDEIILERIEMEVPEHV